MHPRSLLGPKRPSKNLDSKMGKLNERGSRSSSTTRVGMDEVLVSIVGRRCQGVILWYRIRTGLQRSATRRVVMLCVSPVQLVPRRRRLMSWTLAPLLDVTGGGVIGGG